MKKSNLTPLKLAQHITNSQIDTVTICFNPGGGLSDLAQEIIYELSREPYLESAISFCVDKSDFVRCLTHQLLVAAETKKPEDYKPWKWFETVAEKVEDRRFRDQYLVYKIHPPLVEQVKKAIKELIPKLEHEEKEYKELRERIGKRRIYASLGGVSDLTVLPEKTLIKIIGFYKPFRHDEKSPYVYVHTGGSTKKIGPELWLSFGANTSSLKYSCKKEDSAEREKILTEAGLIKISEDDLLKIFWPDVYQEQRRKADVQEKAAIMIKKAFGVVYVHHGGDGDSTAQDAAKKAGLETGREMVNHPLGNGLFGHYIVTGRGIDDYSDGFFVTKGHRDSASLLDFCDAYWFILFTVLPRCSHDFKKPFFECWECGRSVSFWDIFINDSLPAWEAMTERISMIKNGYCGC